jgi:hypothetical protein
MNALKITARPETFRRAGYVFTRTPRFIRLTDLSKAQGEALEAEGKPNGQLIVEPVQHDFEDDAQQQQQQATDAKTPAAKSDGPKPTALRVVAKKDGYNRAGFKFGVEPVIVPLTEHPAKIKAIREDGELTVEEVVHDFGDAK